MKRVATWRVLHADRPRPRRSGRSRRLALATGRTLSPAIWLTGLFLLLLFVTA